VRAGWKWTRSTTIGGPGLKQLRLSSSDCRLQIGQRTSRWNAEVAKDAKQDRISLRPSRTLRSTPASSVGHVTVEWCSWPDDDELPALPRSPRGARLQLFHRRPVLTVRRPDPDSRRRAAVRLRQ